MFSILSRAKLSYLPVFLNRTSSFIQPTVFRSHSRVQPRFTSDSPRDPHRSQRGIWHLKRYQAGMMKCFSMKHTRRTFKVNAVISPLRSKILGQKFYFRISSKARRTIKLYGGLDNYILKSRHEIIQDSKLAIYLKQLMTNKDILSMSRQSLAHNMKMISLPGERKPKRINNNSKIRRYNRVPSVFYPGILKRMDMSKYLIPPDKLISRVEKAEIDRLYDELEVTTDNNHRFDLRKKISELKKENSTEIIEQYKSFEPTRHAHIRNEFMRLKDNFKAKLKYIESLKESENVAKIALGENYKHYSEDYPEVQLMLQQTQIKKQKKIMQKADNSNRYIRDLGELVDKDDTFDPYKGSLGNAYDREIPKNKGIKLVKKEEKAERDKHQKQKFEKQKRIDARKFNQAKIHKINNTQIMAPNNRI